MIPEKMLHDAVEHAAAGDTSHIEALFGMLHEDLIGAGLADDRVSGAMLRAFVSVERPRLGADGIARALRALAHRLEAP